jgi:hypothetical protein
METFRYLCEQCEIEHMNGCLFDEVASSVALNKILSPEKKHSEIFKNRQIAQGKNCPYHSLINPDYIGKNTL